MGIFDRIQGEIDSRDEQEGISPADLLDLPPELRRLMTRITRDGELSAEQAAELLEETMENTQKTLDSLVEKGYLQREERDEGWFYSTRFARKRGRDIPVGIWSALGQRTTKEE